ncbi:hypothetical protein JCM5296_003195 [Sporobolomyces johnsonii]
MNSSGADSYWSYPSGGDEMETVSGAGGYSPAAVPLSSSTGMAQGRVGAEYGGGGGGGTFDPMSNARLSPSAFDPSSFSGQFIVPRFASGGPADPFGMGVGITDTPKYVPVLLPSRCRVGGYSTRLAFSRYSTSQAAVSPMPFDYNFSNQGSTAQRGLTPTSTFYAQSFTSSSASTQPSQRQPSTADATTTSSYPINSQPSTSTSTSSALASTSAVPYAPPISRPLAPLHAPTADAVSEGPIYAPYGSSVISVNQTPNSSYKLPPLAMNLPPSQPSTAPFNPSALGLPAPPPTGQSNNFAGLYSSSGFDMLGVLARVAARPNPQIQIGPVDTSCAFAVVDARRWDQPLVFVSDTFIKMTGYTNEEIIGRNCRFLQSPTGQVVQGAPRKYTDGNAAWHMRTHIQAGKESQSSLINYTKAGRPFINLVTIVPICWDTEEIAYFVGFQVDLVDQPNAILDRMRDGSYIVNYSLVGSAYSSQPIPPVPGATVSMQSIEQAGGEQVDEWTQGEAPAPAQVQTQQQGAQRTQGTGAGTAPAPTGVAGTAESSEKTDEQLLDLVLRAGEGSLDAEVDKRAFHKLLLGHADDFVHVLSLKGSLLYCSPAVARVLEYEPGELVGSTLSSLCHPSDVVPVMRQLKDASSISNPIVKLLYRIRRKHSGYVWIEASGKLHIEPGKGRKCVIAVGRARDVLKMHWNELRQSGGLGDTEFWTKVSDKGMILNATLAVQSVLGFLPQEMVGCSLFDLALPEHKQQLEVAIQQALLGAPASVQYKLKGRRGYLDVVTKFYPRHNEPMESNVEQSPLHIGIIAQTNELNSERRKSTSAFGTQPPVYNSNLSGRSPAVSESDSTSSSGSGGFQSTFKTLTHPSAISDNVFDELETRRPTSWQFELHQLQNTNKKLRDEKDYLMALRRKRGSVYSDARSRKASSDAGSKASSSVNRSCQNCGRTDSPEWRSGPTGIKTLCNACGLRWAKLQKQSATATNGSPVSSNDASQLPSPSTAAFGALAVPLVAQQSGSPSFSPYVAKMDPGSPGNFLA